MTPESPDSLTSHCFHWTERGEECCDCGRLDPDGSLWYVRDCPGKPPAESDSSPVSARGTRKNIVAQLRFEAQMMLDRGVVTRGQRLVAADLMRDAADSIERFDAEEAR